MCLLCFLSECRWPPGFGRGGQGFRGETAINTLLYGMIRYNPLYMYSMADWGRILVSIPPSVYYTSWIRSYLTPPYCSASSRGGGGTWRSRLASSLRGEWSKEPSYWCSSVDHLTPVDHLRRHDQDAPYLSYYAPRYASSRGSRPGARWWG